MIKIYFAILTLFIAQKQYSQVILSADGTTDTYDLINSVLAPGYDVVENPDNSCSEHSEFGEHITQVYDSELEAYVFNFHIHVDEDSDRCKNYDRQRNEIKAYDQSPDNLLGFDGETITYKWKFKLPSDFQYTTSFTHIHQIKPVGGYDSMPLYTLTVAGSTGQLRLRYSEVSESQTTLHSESISDFLGVWVEVTETIKYGTSGTYDIEINQISNGENLFSYTNTNISNWRHGDENNSNVGNDFMRPKWGIYRSLGSDDPLSTDSKRDQLKDEELLYNDFGIEKVENALSNTDFELSENIKVFPNPAKERITIENLPKNTKHFNIYSLQGKKLLYQNANNTNIDTSLLANGNYILKIEGENYSKSQIILIFK